MRTLFKIAKGSVYPIENEIVKETTTAFRLFLDTQTFSPVERQVPYHAVRRATSFISPKTWDFI